VGVIGVAGAGVLDLLVFIYVLSRLNVPKAAHRHLAIRHANGHDTAPKKILDLFGGGFKTTVQQLANLTWVGLEETRVYKKVADGLTSNQFTLTTEILQLDSHKAALRQYLQPTFM
jgi:hypothetical protein